MNTMHAELHSSRELYDKLTQSIANAKKSILLTNLCNDLRPGREWTQYIEQLDFIIKSGTVRVTRVLAANSKDKFQWLLSTLFQHKSHENFTVALLPLSVKSTYYYGLPLNVQIIDQDTIFLIDPTHEDIDSSGDKREHIQLSCDLSLVPDKLTAWYFDFVAMCTTIKGLKVRTKYGDIDVNAIKSHLSNMLERGIITNSDMNVFDRYIENYFQQEDG